MLSSSYDAHLGAAHCWSIIDAIFRHACHMTRLLQVLHCHVFILRHYFGSAIYIRQKIYGLIPSLFSGPFEVRHAPNVRQSNATGNFVRDCQYVSDESIRLHAKIAGRIEKFLALGLSGYSSVSSPTKSTATV